jgi:hypothetical protein
MESSGLATVNRVINHFGIRVMKLSSRHQLWLFSVMMFVAMAYVSATLMIQARDSSKQAESARVLVDIASYSSHLIHELQRERGASAGFIGSQGQYFQDVLGNQRVRTSSVLGDFQRYVKERSTKLATFPVVWSDLEQVNQEISELTNIRQQVSALSISTLQALEYYTHINELLIQISALSVKYSDEPEVNSQLIAYHQFLQGKERAGLERAVLSKTFGAGEFTPDFYRLFIELVTEQNTYLNNYALYATEAQKAEYEKFTQSPEVALVNDFRDKAFNNELNQDPESWYIAATVMIDLLQTQEDQVVAEVLDKIKKLQTTYVFKLWLYLILALCFFLFPLVRILKHVSRP